MMAARLLLILVMAMLLAACSGGGSGPDPGETPGPGENPGPGTNTKITLTGKVVDASSGGIADAAVLLGLNTTTTDAQGKFSFANLTAGKYTISVGTADGGFECREINLSSTASDFEFTLPASGNTFTVKTVSPPLNTTGVALDTWINITFTENIDPASVNLDDFILTPDLGDLSVNVNGDTISLVPELQLPTDQLVLIELTGTIGNDSGDDLQSPLRWRFRSSAADSFAPQLKSITPKEGTTGFPPNLSVSFSFNEVLGDIDDGFTAVITPEIDLEATTAGNTLYLRPADGWTYDTAYNLIISGVTDTHGNRDQLGAELNFTTGDTPSAGDDIQPEWNKVLNTIVFASNRAGSYDIYRIQPDGTGLVQLTNHPGDELHPTVSGDGELLAYQARGVEGTWNIYVRSMDGTSDAIAVTAANSNDTDPFFSRTVSDKIIYVSDSSSPRGLYTMNPDGTNPTEIDRNFSSTQSQPSLHPLLDNEILFSAPGVNGSSIWRKTVSAIDGSAVNQELTGSVIGNELSPVWDPSASEIYFISNSSGVYNLWEAEPNGAFAHQISFLEQDASDPSISPVVGDTRCVLSVKRESTGSYLVLIDLVSGEVVAQLTGQEVAD